MVYVYIYLSDIWDILLVLGRFSNTSCVNIDASRERTAKIGTSNEEKNIHAFFIKYFKILFNCLQQMEAMNY